MKINFPSLFQTPIHKYNVFFIFGNDLSVFERTISFLQKKRSLPLCFKTEEDLLTHSFSQPSLFTDQAESSLTLVSPVTDKCLNAIDQLKKGVFILTSEKARTQSKLVKYFTQSSTSLAIAAYACPLMTSEFEFLVGETNLPLSFKGLLFKAYQNDYMGLLTALEKIKLHGDVTEAHYTSFLDTPAFFDEFALLNHAFLSKDEVKITQALSCITPTNLIPFFRSLIRCFQTLFELMPFKRSPKTISWQSLTPPIFFKDQPFFEAALSRWHFEEVHSFLETLLTLEERVKFLAYAPPQIAQTLLQFLRG